ncbi:carbohydrate kinase [Escherichia coli]|nr:carbohydrate kinase [Enterobacter roggenkampii]MDU9742327.1 carbohydrate kinase [Escherichia coli]WCF42228.1 carbohydrate kinase [Enterobacter roggenkampii]
MLRIGQVEATATQDGKYTDGSVAGGIAATRLRAAAFNAMQEELAHIVESAGLALDINDMTQVLKAIQKLTLSRANPFADIKSDGAAAISTALTNLQLVGGLGSSTVGRLVGVQVITSSGMYTPTPGAKFGIGRGVGGGAGGGGSSTPPSGQVSSAAGGNSGSYGETKFTITGPISVTIGAGGNGGTGSASSTGANIGGAGGDTIFGTIMTCPGGSSGLASNSFTVPSVCQSIQTKTAPCTGANIVSIDGEAGGQGLAIGTGLSGRGGGNPLGSGGNHVGSGGSLSVVGNNGAGYGSGGSGAFSGSSGAGKAGGNGAPGVIIIMEYA